MNWKKLTATLAAFALATLGVVQYATAGEMVNSNKLRQNLYGTCFVSEDEGWSVGDLGRIFHTINGGRDWEIQDSGTKRPFVAITCIDRSNLYAVGQSGQISKTTDGGKTWKALQSGVDRQLLDVSFADVNRGIAVGDYGRILRTDDAGITWTTISVPPDTKLPEEVAEVVEPGDILLYAVNFADRDHVFIVGEFGVILGSDDAGQTFHSLASPVGTTLFGVYFADGQHGWAVGMEATLLSTTDGGATWAKIPVDTPKGFSLALYDVAVNKESQVGWAVGNNGFLLNSMDGGQSWQRISVPVQLGSSWFRAISLLPDGKGFTVGANGMVLTTNKQSFTPLKERF